LHGFDLLLCAQIGTLAATYCLEEKGTQKHCYQIDEFVKRFRTQFDDGGMLDSFLIKRDQSLL